MSTEAAPKTGSAGASGSTPARVAQPPVTVNAKNSASEAAATAITSDSGTIHT